MNLFIDTDIRILSASKKERKYNIDIDILKKVGFMCSPTYFAILLGSIPTTVPSHSSSEKYGKWALSNSLKNGDVSVIDATGTLQHVSPKNVNIGIRPVLDARSVYPSNSVTKNGSYLEVTYGEYPQEFASMDNEFFEKQIKDGYLVCTGKKYTIPSNDMNGFRYITVPEYCTVSGGRAFDGRKYVRLPASNFSNARDYLPSSMFKTDYYIFEVKPIVWLYDTQSNLLLSKEILAAGVPFYNYGSNVLYDGKFNKTVMYDFLNKHFSKDIIPSETPEKSNNQIQEIEESESMKNQSISKKKSNPYNLNLKEVSEEEIIRGSIESGVAVFLHGPSSEGKSARVKQIDPDCEIIYLRNASPDSLNGKSVYNQETGEMIDIKPTWLKKVEEKCEKEPDKFHVIFFDEITNALPSIQGIAFNIVLDREVNGKWKLPENARIVAAGNDMKDSLAANQLAEPLFNRFAHVYIKTTTENWLKWASENNIHPAIYSYIAYKNGETLRTKYDGEKPNADPRKWEMASKMLYATESPEMLRALVGEEITKEFVEFCNQEVITLDDVIKGNYVDDDIYMLNTAQRYATTMGLTQVDEINLEKVRDFVMKLGAEFVAIFDVLWTHGDEAKLERLAEAKLAERVKGGIKNNGR